MQKILIADDEPNILLLTEMLFKEMGLNVITAADGQEAYTKIVQEVPDIIVTDVIMPHKSGFEICKEVRANPDIAHIPIIILSALGDDYNKINGLEGGADDYITKPFNVEELKARVKVLLLRHQQRTKIETPPEDTQVPAPTEDVLPNEPSVKISHLATQNVQLDEHLGGGIPAGSNILLVGPTGCSKSFFARQFLCEGLRHGERGLFVALDDNPMKIREEMNNLLSLDTAQMENSNLLRMVDAYSWTTLAQTNEKYAITGMLDLNQLSGVISDAGYDLGQTVQHKAGGRRIIDSISSLLIHFDLPAVQRFLSQVARTAISFGNVTTLFIIEEGTVDEQVLNNIKYIMDGVLEFRRNDDLRQVKVGFMKWSQYKSEWTNF